MQSESKSPEEIKKELSKPFPLSDIEWRIQSAGEKNGKQWAMCLAYVTNRAIMERLDEVLGIENWQNIFKHSPHIVMVNNKPVDKGSNLCGISIKFGDEWVTKWDGAENTDIEAVKGGISGAMKRAAVQWGIGRYLYNLEAGWATIMPKGQGEFRNGKYTVKEKGKADRTVYFEWNPPALPEWALPERDYQEPVPEKKPEPKKSEPEPTLDKPSFEDVMMLEMERIGAKRFVELLGQEGFSDKDELLGSDRNRQVAFYNVIVKENDKDG